MSVFFVNISLHRASESAAHRRARRSRTRSRTLLRGAISGTPVSPKRVLLAVQHLQGHHSRTSLVPQAPADSCCCNESWGVAMRTVQADVWSSSSILPALWRSLGDSLGATKASGSGTMAWLGRQKATLTSATLSKDTIARQRPQQRQREGQRQRRWQSQWQIQSEPQREPVRYSVPAGQEPPTPWATESSRTLVPPPAAAPTAAADSRLEEVLSSLKSALWEHSPAGCRCRYYSDIPAASFGGSRKRLFFDYFLILMFGLESESDFGFGSGSGFRSDSGSDLFKGFGQRSDSKSDSKVILK